MQDQKNDVEHTTNYMRTRTTRFGNRARGRPSSNPTERSTTKQSNHCRESLFHRTGSLLCCGKIPSLIAVYLRNNAHKAAPACARLVGLIHGQPCAAWRVSQTELAATVIFRTIKSPLYKQLAGGFIPGVTVSPIDGVLQNSNVPPRAWGPP